MRTSTKWLSVALPFVVGACSSGTVVVESTGECGDGTVTAAEACDDGNTTSGDGCSDTCALEAGYSCPSEGGSCTQTAGAVCGNGVRELREACDDGNTTDGDGCSAACDAIGSGFGCPNPGSSCVPLGVCSNGLVETGEVCDDGNMQPADGCSADCSQVEDGFACPEPGEACVPTNVCGNGILDAGEACDDGNAAGGDGCAADCSFTEIGFTCPVVGEPCVAADVCGNTLVEAGEACDDGNTSDGDGCTADCSMVETGNTCPPAGGACVPSDVCGNGLLESGEACDDGNTVASDGCSDTCTVDGGYTCPDEGELCVPADVCGNGVLETGEGCDDGNAWPLDGCTELCAVEMGYSCPTEDEPCVPLDVCGNGVIEGSEGCDDGNPASDDGCSSACEEEMGYTCPTEGEPCVLDCGNGQQDGAEQCDDGNRQSTDGCSSTCTLEPRFDCPTFGMPCISLCGNTVVDSGETCDDGNTTSETECPYGTATCTACDSTCDNELNLAGRSCGDGTLDSDDGEVCDDGNTITETACGGGLATCTLCNATCDMELNLTGGVECGDGSIDPGETCDDGNTVTETACPYGMATCSACSDDCMTDLNLTGNVCGDGDPDPANETCDDGNTNTEGACPYGTPTCTACNATCDMALNLTGNVCGDSVPDAINEACDDGNLTTEAECPYGTASCSLCNAACDTVLNLTGNVCGDNDTDASNEVCDDGNTTTETECPYGTPACTLCDATCQSTLGLTGNVCGDNVPDATNEACDDGNLTTETSCPYGTASCTQCNAACDTELNLTGPICGDNTTDGGFGEVCDDGVNNGAYNGCNPGCTSRPAFCGDDTTDSPLEECDDGVGNDGSYGGCNSNCTLAARCGDGNPDAGDEECDNGTNNGAYGTCNADCSLAPFCGDNTTDAPFESCDNGVNDGSYGTCTPTCRRAPFCGDGRRTTPQEGCDDGMHCSITTTTSCVVDGDCPGGETCQAVGGDGCEGDCTDVEFGYSCPDEGQPCVLNCGNGQFDAGEACDDGNQSGGDGCSADCLTVQNDYECLVPGQLCTRRCGNGTIDTACDFSGTPCVSDGDCPGAESCVPSEACDDGRRCSTTTTQICNTDADCPGAETCTTADLDGCSADCSTIDPLYECPTPGQLCNLICGNGVVNAPEECDLGAAFNLGAYGGCNSDCTDAGFCGDGIPQMPPEECDDGTNDGSYDGCRSSCTLALNCGDGILTTPQEECDDGNGSSGDGCESCVIQPGYVCPTVGDLCNNLCGNGIRNVDEACDDGNLTGGDGCNETCTAEEPGYDCPIEGSACVAASCGDGIVAGDETCDDGNGAAGDGCSNRCEVELGFDCPVAGMACNATDCGDGVVEGLEQCDDGGGLCEDVYIEAEDYTSTSSVVGAHTWELSSALPGFTDTGYMESSPNSGTSCGTDPTNCGAVLTYDIDLPVGGTYYLHVRTSSPSTSDNSILWEFDGGTPVVFQSSNSDDSWAWNTAAGSFTLSSGPHTLSIYMREDGHRLDAIQISLGSAPGDGGTSCRSDGDCSGTCFAAAGQPGDGCDANCQLEDGFGCPVPGAACIPATCGDGFVGICAGGTAFCNDDVDCPGVESCLETGETCDDGGTCSATAMSCISDGMCPGVETCDAVGGDGCSTSCTVESGSACPTPGSPCVSTTCGDGAVEGTEECDDGGLCTGTGSSCALNSDCAASETCFLGECLTNCTADTDCAGGETCEPRAGDGCNPACVAESIFACNSTGTCVPECGDGITLAAAGEQCDDGNTASGDGCSAACTIESGYTCTDFSIPSPTSIDVPITYRDFSDAHPDMQTNSGDYPRACGMVETQLDGEGKPVYTGNPLTYAGPGLICGGSSENDNVSTAGTFSQWYRDISGTNLRIDSQLTLSELAAGTCAGTGNCGQSSRAACEAETGCVWTPDRYQFSSGSFFPLTGLGFGDEGRANNYHFTSELRAYFRYQGGEFLEFFGDDDVFVFINGELAVDIGGVHPQELGDVTLQSDGYDERFDIYPNGIYPVTVFQAERQTTGSNYQLTIGGFVNTGTASCVATCGDGLIRAGEECDNGGECSTAGTACDEDADCPGGETCDPQNGDGCDDTCQVEPGYNCTGEPSVCTQPVCGDLVVESPESCDDGGLCSVAATFCDEDADCPGAETCDPQSGDGCSDTCVLEACPDGNVDAGYCSITTGTACNFDAECPIGEVCVANEECDDNNSEPSDACTNACTVAFCGDGVLHTSDPTAGVCSVTFATGCTSDVECPSGEYCVLLEECDDGNGVDTDACTNSCTTSFCGDGRVGPSETCDDGVNNGGYGSCLFDCSAAAPSCGDGNIDVGFEQCDDGVALNDGTYGGCAPDCMFAPSCGDADIGVCSTTITTSCSVDGDCPVAETCVTVDECDDGVNDGTNCESDCTLPIVCGDGIVATGEECDEGSGGNTGAYGTCTATCQDAAFCGDGTPDVGFEECDLGVAGNLGGYDGCDTNCTLTAYCGDGYLGICDTSGAGCDVDMDCPLAETCLGTVETCDDGVLSGAYGGCNINCTPAARCGDGDVDSGEECDLGDGFNLGGYGGCNADCTLPAFCGDGREGQCSGDAAPCDDDGDCLSMQTCEFAENCDDGVLDGSYGGCTTLCDDAPYCGDSNLSGVCSMSAGIGCNLDTDCPPAETCTILEVCDNGTNDGSYGTCRANCQLAPFCGDGVIDTASGGEECETNGMTDVFGGRTCADLDGDGLKEPGDFDGGVLACSSCGLDTSGCFRCGDGVRNGFEDCDGVGLCGVDSDCGVNTCEELGFATGTGLGCAFDCTYDLSGCDVSGCGNNVLDPGEQCDVVNGTPEFNGRTCTDLDGDGMSGEPGDFDGGMLDCAPDCTLDTSACTFCGDGVRNGTEVCDGLDTNGVDCTSGSPPLTGGPYTGGTLACNPTCDGFDESGCTACSNCLDCGGQACIDGQCGSCFSDGDCCAPLRCTAGGTCQNF